MPCVVGYICEDVVVRCWGGCDGPPWNTLRTERPSHARHPLAWWRLCVEHDPKLLASLYWKTCMLRNTAHWETKGSDSWEWLVDPWGSPEPSSCLWRLREVSARSKGDSLPTERPGIQSGATAQPHVLLSNSFSNAAPSAKF